ncbi:acetyl/propionyl/methylcrotonyl-CoA carboxylase subunit alpha [Micromonospora sp. U21]|uniref:acetyl-CoA carboxylase biotin carboxylase subunit n=1 Tax=Micromonospora sp. U21 TaxID=2824899 RepID=UPI001B386E51|nr:acetyl-CoA carboxylase biotin carboxylase subunit [Micromonospora sp. U21]MBQ0905008.1 acetyl-CoA carboxylase biotin carboxylase subunit [Micromonospora sp. U21]
MAIRRVLVANRGEIAVRIIRACRDVGIETVAVFSEADRDTLATQLADKAVCIGPVQAKHSYLNADALLVTALHTGCDALHPGYGFLAENAEFADECARNGIQFIGPRGDTMRGLGDKLPARETAERLGIPVVPGGTLDGSAASAGAVLKQIGLPLLVKASAGGGGRGLRRVDDSADLAGALAQSAAEADAAFGNPTLYVERYIERGRHIEVQIVGDRYGNVIHLFERDCTTQRRYQKLVEEAPSPVLDDAARKAITDSACRLARGMGYEGAGTVEFLFDLDTGEHYFIEMNTRLQVEHPVSELLTGLDLVRLQLLVASGEPLPVSQDEVTMSGHVIEFRVNCEDPGNGFLPAAGTVRRWRPPAGPWVRLDTHMEQGQAVPPYYDSLLAKLIVWGDTREQALERSRRCLAEFAVDGVPTTLPFHSWLVAQPDFIFSNLHTTWVDGNWKGARRP